ncbi:MAG: MotA/TolQ/ExbB proton channel family protein [Cyclobacteriaceae bacterium]|nr:MotA/TolQ/ExbB proton channel family protein [Cyclobacteriaceae bacterium]
MSLSDLHTQGGDIWMFPVDLCLIAVTGLMIFLVVARLQGKTPDQKWLEAIRHVGGLGLATGAFGTLAGFCQAFGALEEIKEGLPFYVIAGGVKVALITVIYGSLVYMWALTGYLVLRLTQKS